MKKIAVCTIWKNERQPFPYPPLFDFENMDYICFTNNKNIKSEFWKIEYREDLEEIEQEIQAFPDRFLLGYQKVIYLQENQILVNDLEEKNAIITIPSNPFSETKSVGRISDVNGTYLHEKNVAYQEAKYLLTIGIPVSNQIKTIERCLKGLEPLRKAISSELIIVDTGSTDGTIEVAKQYGAKIISYPWCDNISVVRNAAIREARGIWYMSADDDEWFEDITEIIHFFTEGTYQQYTMATYIQRNFVTEEGKYRDYFQVRIAKIKPDLHFEGRIHDALVVKDSDEICALNAAAYHKGFLYENAEEHLRKTKRNCSLLQFDIEEFPLDLRYNFQLANEFFTIENYEESIAYLIKGLSLMKELPIYKNKNMSYKRMHKIYLFLQFYFLKSEEFFFYQRLADQETFGIMDSLLIYHIYISLGEQYKRGIRNLFNMGKEFERLAEKYREDPFLHKQEASADYNPVEENFMRHEYYRCMLNLSIWLEKKEAILFLEQLLKLELSPKQRLELLTQILRGNSKWLWKKAMPKLRIEGIVDDEKRVFCYAVQIGGNVRLALFDVAIEDLNELEEKVQRLYPEKLKKIVNGWKPPYTEKEEYLISCIQNRAHQLEEYKQNIEDCLAKQNWEELRNFFQKESKIWDWKSDIEIAILAVMVKIEEEERIDGLQEGILMKRRSRKEAVSFWRNCCFLLWRAELRGESGWEEFLTFIRQEGLSEKALQYLLYMKSTNQKKTILRLVESMMKDKRWKDAFSLSVFLCQQYPKEREAVENMIAVAALLKQDELVVKFTKKLQQLELEEHAYVE